MDSLVHGFFNLVIAIFNIILSPITNVIESNFPALNDVASHLVPVFSIINDNWIPWIKDVTFLPSWAWTFIFDYIIFHFTVIVFTNVFKIVAQWWATLH